MDSRKKFAFILALLIIQLANSDRVIASSKTDYYIAPGLRIGWNFRRGLSFGMEISFCLAKKLGWPNGTRSCNITLGTRMCITCNKKVQNKSYYFFKLQYCDQPFLRWSNALAVGGGFGFAFFNKNATTLVRPMISLYTGFIIYPAVDILFLDSKKINLDFGVFSAFFIPLQKSKDWGFN